MTITTKNFNGKLASLITSAKTQRGNLQALIFFGLEQYRQHGDTGYLTRMLNQCIGVKSLPTVTIKDYIKAHANVKWTKGKDGKMTFKKADKEITVTIPDVVWYEWAGASHNNVKADLDAVAQAKALLARITKNLKDHKVKNEAEAQAIADALKSVLPA